MDPTLQGFAPLDLIGAVLVSILLALGAWRGLWWQVIRLCGVVLAVMIARLLSERGALWIGSNWPDLPLRAAHGISWMGFFLLALGASSLLGMLGQRLLEIMQLGLLNRVAGGVLGAATGFLLHVALLMGLCQLAPPNFVETHVAGTVSEGVVDLVGSQWRVVLGAEAAAEVDRLLGGAPDWADPPPPGGFVPGSLEPGIQEPGDFEPGEYEADRLAPGGLEPGSLDPSRDVR